MVAVAARDRADVLVVGGGVFGLWAAKRAVEAGLSTALVDPLGAAAAGAPMRASGGLLGALTAHAPHPWNDKKQFQFDALVELSAVAAALEAETGRSVGYRRCGRLMPIRNAVYRAQVETRSAAAAENWRVGDGDVFAYEARSRLDPALDGWLADEARSNGAVWDALAARLDPRRYVAALWAWLAPRATVIDGVRFLGWDGAARLSDGRRLAAGAVVVAAGVDAFSLLEAARGRPSAEDAAAAPLGGGVKGQSVALRPPPGAPRLDAFPLIYEDGVYVVPHDDGRVAVGGTNRTEWTDRHATDPADDEFLRRARALCPPLSDAKIVEWWAGVRPRARSRDPLVGPLPGAAPLYAFAGGYKISFGVAHRAAAALIGGIAADASAPALPDAFRTDRRLAG